MVELPRGVQSDQCRLAMPAAGRAALCLLGRAAPVGATASYPPGRELATSSAHSTVSTAATQHGQHQLSSLVSVASRRGFPMEGAGASEVRPPLCCLALSLPFTWSVRSYPWGHVPAPSQAADWTDKATVSPPSLRHPPLSFKPTCPFVTLWGFKIHKWQQEPTQSGPWAVCWTACGGPRGAHAASAAPVLAGTSAPCLQHPVTRSGSSGLRPSEPLGSALSCLGPRLAGGAGAGGG